MKAKDYFEQFKKDETPEAVARIAFAFLEESKEIAEQRHARSNAALFGILNELDDKWRAFARLAEADHINPDGFKIVVREIVPSVYYLWMSSRKHGRQQVMKTMGQGSSAK